ncbi:MAG: MlaA family lipoprotein, partial [Steroidobacteraceae bacterium]
TLSACATTQTADSRDPFEPINRVSYAVNDGLDRALVKPAAKAYKTVMPQFVQTGVSNVFSNAKYPVTLVNNALQGKFGAAANDAGRFLLNSTVGLGGLLDPATAAGLDRNDEDFGQTFGVWGIGPGPYFVIPLFGPTTLRDGFGSIADDFAEPRSYLKDSRTRWSLWAVDKFETRVRLLDADTVLERSGDPYAFVRSAYLQRREFQVRDGNMPAEDLEAEFAEDEDAEPAAEPPPTP